MNMRVSVSVFTFLQGLLLVKGALLNRESRDSLTGGGVVLAVNHARKLIGAVDEIAVRDEKLFGLESIQALQTKAADIIGGLLNKLESMHKVAVEKVDEFGKEKLAQLEKAIGDIKSLLSGIQLPKVVRGAVAAKRLTGIVTGKDTRLSPKVTKRITPLTLKPKLCHERGRVSCGANDECAWLKSRGLCMVQCSSILVHADCDAHPACVYADGLCKNDCSLGTESADEKDDLQSISCGHCKTESGCQYLSDVVLSSSSDEGGSDTPTCQFVKASPPTFLTDKCISTGGPSTLTDEEKAKLVQIREADAASKKNSDATDGHSTNTCSPPDITHGHVVPERLAFAPGESANIVCDEGYSPTSIRTTIECDEDGEFDSVVMCIAGKAGRKQKRVLAALHGAVRTAAAH